MLCAHERLASLPPDTIVTHTGECEPLLKDTASTISFVTGRNRQLEPIFDNIFCMIAKRVVQFCNQEVQAKNPIVAAVGTTCRLAIAMTGVTTCSIDNVPC